MQLNNNVIGILPALANVDASGAVSIAAISGDFFLNVFMVNFTSNHNKGRDGGALTVLLPYDSSSIHKIYITDCSLNCLCR